jgi:hypothetical protein
VNQDFGFKTNPWTFFDIFTLIYAKSFIVNAILMGKCGNIIIAFMVHHGNFEPVFWVQNKSMEFFQYFWRFYARSCIGNMILVEKCGTIIFCAIVHQATI